MQSYSPVLDVFFSSSALKQNPRCCGMPVPGTGSTNWKPRKDSSAVGRAYVRKRDVTVIAAAGHLMSKSPAAHSLACSLRAAFGAGVPAGRLRLGGAVLLRPLLYCPSWAPQRWQGRRGSALSPRAVQHAELYWSPNGVSCSESVRRGVVDEDPSSHCRRMSQLSKGKRVREVSASAATDGPSGWRRSGDSRQDV